MVGQCQAHKRVKVILGKGNNMKGKQKSKQRDHLEFRALWIFKGNIKLAAQVC